MKAALRWLVVLGFGLAACLPRPPLPTSTAEPPTPIPTVTPVAATATPRPTTTPTPLPTPEPTPTQASRFAPPSQADWQSGPADAAVTIVEYGDYQ